MAPRKPLDQGRNQISLSMRSVNMAGQASDELSTGVDVDPGTAHRGRGGRHG
ncbi:MAG: hypothetical protein ABIQ18_17685 [Umezawaea sp.]